MRGARRPIPILLVKLLRELWWQRAQTISVAVVMMLGVAAFLASYGGYRDLSDSFDATLDRLHVAAWHLDVKRLTPGDLARIRQLPGVSVATSRVLVDFPTILPHGELAPGVQGRVQLDGRFITIPDRGEPPLDRLQLLAGHLPGPGEVLVERRFAAFHHLVPGDTVALGVGEAALPLRIAGIGVSGEYLWVSRSAQDLIPPFTTFGVFWIGRSTLASVARQAELLLAATGAPGGLPQELPELALAADPSRSNQLLVDLAPAASATSVLRRVEAMLGRGTVRTVRSRSDLPGVQTLRLDLSALRELAVFFPTLFLVVGGFIVAALLARLVDAQRPLVGTLLALGFSSRRILAHYLGFALAVCLLGAALGDAIGVPGGRFLTRAYAGVVELPYVQATSHPALILAGLGLGLLVGLVAGVLPAFRAARLAPAEAMRPGVQPANPAIALFRHIAALPLGIRLALRNILRAPIRSLTTVLGVAAAMVLLVVSGGAYESARQALDNEFTQSLRYDLQVDFVTPRGTARLLQQVGHLPGVIRVEPVLSLPVALQAGPRTFKTMLQAVPPRGQLLRPVDLSGRPALVPGELTLSGPVADKLDVRAGDIIRVHLLPSGAPVTVRVGRLAQLPVGGTALMALSQAQRLFKLPAEANTLVIRAPGKAIAVREAIQGLPGVIRVSPTSALRALIGTFTRLLDTLVGVMFLFSVILAAAILYNTASLALLERRREVATELALGFGLAALGQVATLENAILALLGLATGYPIANWAFDHAISLYHSTIFSLPPLVTWQTFLIAAAAIMIVLLLAQVPVLIQVGRMDLADAVRSRE